MGTPVFPKLALCQLRRIKLLNFLKNQKLSVDFCAPSNSAWQKSGTTAEYAQTWSVRDKRFIPACFEWCYPSTYFVESMGNAICKHNASQVVWIGVSSEKTCVPTWFQTRHRKRCVRCVSNSCVHAFVCYSKTRLVTTCSLTLFRPHVPQRILKRNELHQMNMQA